jgi:D-glycero-D-manno-heptose 1,7-bisphosphate phosphatase
MGVGSKMKKAIFLDRDGTINKLIFNKELNEFEPPHCRENFEMIDGAVEAMKNLQQSEFLLFVISNQPDYAKGKTTLENLHKVHEEFERQLEDKRIKISGFYYCYHHPNGIVKEYSFDCNCRKPSPYFANKVIEENNIDKTASWFIGDRESDIICGKLAGLNTAFLNKGQGKPIMELSEDINAPSLFEAAERILKHNMKGICQQ